MMIKKIMIVDSELYIAKMLSDFLIEEGFNTAIFKDPLLAIEEFNRYNNAYSCILTDLMLPGISGDELIHDIRLKDKNIPIILMSTELPASLSAVLRIFEQIYYVKKPFRLGDIILIIEDSLNKKLELSSDIS